MKTYYKVYTDSMHYFMFKSRIMKKAKKKTQPKPAI